MFINGSKDHHNGWSWNLQSQAGNTHSLARYLSGLVISSSTFHDKNTQRNTVAEGKQMYTVAEGKQMYTVAEGKQMYTVAEGKQMYTVKFWYKEDP